MIIGGNAVAGTVVGSGSASVVVVDVVVVVLVVVVVDVDCVVTYDIKILLFRI